MFARSGDGEACPIGAPPDAEGLSDQVAKLLCGVDLLLNSQQVIDRNLQTALTAKSAAHAEPVVAALGRMAEPPAGTQARITAVERFVVRLDQHLSRLSREQVKSPVITRQIPSVALWAVGVSSIALVVSIAELVRSLGGDWRGADHLPAAPAVTHDPPSRAVSGVA